VPVFLPFITVSISVLDLFVTQTVQAHMFLLTPSRQRLGDVVEAELD
jgi:hypothetical protein